MWRGVELVSRLDAAALSWLAAVPSVSVCLSCSLSLDGESVDESVEADGPAHHRSSARLASLATSALSLQLRVVGGEAHRGTLATLQRVIQHAAHIQLHTKAQHTQARACEQGARNGAARGFARRCLLCVTCFPMDAVISEIVFACFTGPEPD